MLPAARRLRCASSLAIALACLPGGGPARPADDPIFRPKPLEKTVVAPARLAPIDRAAGVWAVDFGRAAFGTIRFRATTADDGAVVVVHLGEVIEAASGRIDRAPGGSRRYRAIRQVLRRGTHDYEVVIPPDARNTLPAAVRMPADVGEVVPFRYCELEGFPGELSPDDIRQVRVHYPFNRDAASFSSSNPVLNRVWELCKYSIEATSSAGVYVDGDRERIPYEGDAYINQLAHYALDTEFAPARRTLDHLLDHPTWPVEWHQHLPLIAWEEWLHTGRRDLLDRRYDALVSQLLQPLAREDGLLRIDDRAADPAFLRTIGMQEPIRTLVDWPAGERDGHVIVPVDSVVNAFQYRSLVVMSEIAEAVGRREDARRFKAKAARVFDAYQRVFFDAEMGLYRDGEGVAHHSLHANLFPLAFDLVPPGRRADVVRFLRSRGMACSVYAAQHLIDGLYRAGAADEALGLLASTAERSWAHMLEVGSTITLEAWDNRFKPNQDWNHAWGAAPADLIPRRLMGIEPVSPGFRRARIRPQLGSLEHAFVRTPTLLGPIELDVRQDATGYRVDVSLPPGMTAELLLPGRPRPVELGAGRRTIRVDARR
jgi:alpha-L-rhamnosidase